MSAKVYKILKGVVRGADGKTYSDEVPFEQLGGDDKRRHAFVKAHVASGQIEAKKAPKAPTPPKSDKPIPAAFAWTGGKHAPAIAYCPALRTYVLAPMP